MYSELRNSQFQAHTDKTCCLTQNKSLNLYDTQDFFFFFTYKIERIIFILLLLQGSFGLNEVTQKKPFEKYKELHECKTYYCHQYTKPQRIPQSANAVYILQST